MTRIPEYERGFGDGRSSSVDWLHKRAAEMSDPHAKDVLNSAATNLGWEEGFRRQSTRPGHRQLSDYGKPSDYARMVSAGYPDGSSKGETGATEDDGDANAQ